MTLRRTGKLLYRPLRLKGLNIIAPCGFVFASLTLYWARWPLTGEVLFIIMGGLPIYFYYQAKVKWKGFRKNFRAGLWMVIYLLCMMLVSYLGSEKFGGKNIIPYGWDMLIIAGLSLVFYVWGLKSGFETEYLQEACKVNEEMRVREEEITSESYQETAV
jgi:amino acid transporter